MTIREKIIIGATAVAVAYAGFSLVQARRQRPSGGSPVPKAGELQAFVAQSRTQLSGAQLSVGERAVLDASRKEWDGEPFAVFSGEGAVKTDSRGPADYRYTGFAQVGGQRFAIINGREYRDNEALLDGTGVVDTIEPDRVVLRLGGENRLRTLMFDDSRVRKD